MRLLLLGATGLVGSRTLQLALNDEAITAVYAPTRRPLSPHGKLHNPASGAVESFAAQLKPGDVDAVICALGTTKAKAGTEEAFRYVDYELPVLYGRAAHAVGVQTYALVSAIGASTKSWIAYARTKGDVEREIASIGFRSLTICRPSIIGGERNEARLAERITLELARVLAPIVPRKFRVNPADAIAKKLLGSVLAARPGNRWIYAEEMTGE